VFLRYFYIIILLIFLPKNAFCQTTPKLRSLTTERPSKSDSIYTLNRGKFLFETSLLSKTFIDNSSQKIKAKSLFDFSTFRYGINNQNEIQIIQNPLIYKKISQQNSSQKIEGRGETFLRFKHNFLGNDDGKFGLALTPFIKIIKSSSNQLGSDLRGGLIMPFQIKILDDLTLGGMHQLNYYKTQNNFKNSRYFAIINAYYLSKDLTTKTSSYLEFYSLKTFVNKNMVQNYIDFGVNYLLTDNLKLDVGANFGVSKKADDLNYFSGLAYRF
jgi:hypothetical protein